METPLAATHRLTLQYHSDLSHVQNILCNAHNTGSVWSLDEFGGGSVFASVGATDVANVFAPIMGTDSAYDSYELSEFVGGAYVLRETGSLGISGSLAGHLSTPGQQWTFSFFDGASKHVKQRVEGFPSGTPAKYGYGVLPAAYKAIVDAFLAAVPDSIGSWAGGRAHSKLTRFVFLVGSFNRKSRRRLGLT